MPDLSPTTRLRPPGPSTVTPRAAAVAPPPWRAARSVALEAPGDLAAPAAGEPRRLPLPRLQVLTPHAENARRYVARFVRTDPAAQGVELPPGIPPGPGPLAPEIDDPLAAHLRD